MEKKKKNIYGAQDPNSTVEPPSPLPAMEDLLPEFFGIIEE